MDNATREALAKLDGFCGCETPRYGADTGKLCLSCRKRPGPNYDEGEMHRALVRWKEAAPEGERLVNILLSDGALVTLKGGRNGLAYVNAPTFIEAAAKALRKASEK